MRCSHEQEMDLMYPETNRQNYKSFENILEYFFMEKKFENATIRNLSNHKRSYKENYLDKFFQLNSQRRVFYEIEIAADEDIAYIRYLTIINEHKFKDDKQHNLFKQYRCGGYNTFIKGTIIDGKQQIKLFKFLLKQGILTKENVDELNSLKKKNRVLLCISRNPIDYLFCSTHQSYTSCISLDSEYESAYYMGLGGLSLDPNRVLLFTTTGALRSYQIKGNTFKHFRYACRTWGIMDKKYKLLTIKNYPSPTPNFAKQLNKIGIKAGIYEDKSVGLFNFEVPKFINGDIAFIDLEEMFFDGCKEHNFVKYSKNGSMGGTDRSFYFTRGFEQLQDFEDLSDECIYCGSCGDASDPEDVLTDRNGEPYCANCYHERYSSCDECGEETYRDDIYSLEDTYLCEYCYNKLSCECENCNEVSYKDSMKYFHDCCYCKDCYDDLIDECYGCGNKCYNDDMMSIEHEHYCEDCYEDIKKQEEENEVAEKAV